MNSGGLAYMMFASAIALVVIPISVDASVAVRAVCGLLAGSMGYNAYSIYRNGVRL